MKVILRGTTLGLLLCLSFIIGYTAHSLINVPVSQPAEAQQSEVFPLLTEAHNYVEQFYVKDQPDQRALEYAIIRAYLSQLGDPYTFFIEPAVAASESDALAGRYGGIGVDIRRDEQANFVLYPYPQSPAERVGI